MSSNQLVSLVVGSGILTLLTFIDFVSERVSGVLGTILNEMQLGGSFSVFDTSSFGIAENLFKKELDWVRRQPQARGTKAKYRLDAFDDLKKKLSKNNQG